MSDDVRECPSGDTTYKQGMFACRNCGEDAAAHEFRPRGTVTDAAHDRDGMMICRKCGEGLTALDVIDGEKPCPGPRGTVTDAEVGRAVVAYRDARNSFGHMNSDVHFQCMRAALEAAREETR